jgi:hypothetical protein
MTMPPLSNGLSVAEVNFLRRLTREPDFRAAYFEDPQAVARAEGLAPGRGEHGEITGSPLVGRLSETQIDGLYRAANAVGSARADDNCTLVYAVAFAVAFALFITADVAVGGQPEIR